jgi:hypothetical protein
MGNCWRRFFLFFPKNNNDNLRWRTIGVSPITTGKRLFAVRLDVCRALYFGRMTNVCLTFIFYRAHGKGLVCRASGKSISPSLSHPELVKYHYLKKLCCALSF